MKTASLVAGLMALAAFSAVPASAQAVRPAGDGSGLRGFSLGVHLNGSHIQTPGSDTRMVPAGGLGITLGYGISERIQAFVRTSSGYRNSQVDLGARYRFGRPGQALRPYAEVAVSRIGTIRGPNTDSGNEPFNPLVRSTGYGLTAGAGVEYTISPRLGLDLGLVHTRGQLSRPPSMPELGKNVAATRIHLGVTWRP